ncbi:exopolyphosphatase/guanosine-5'-triphosphate,3'-diphosphate pyrophosphatase [Ereboglobus sp. PH5-5]|uniref:Ppx/GppA phosphatase family protein n=1 Tax=Ereboglobus sp. PH5-5 TaxID=2940529 RepID=UPI002406480C|nr:phosphatase [Ereboglobus sp. PH5-5]MDF9832849.1 exopolyphosphatase/guanosine-5'-triphosphate,3'-diphosphate pyrophosphatase [Ereboglobus sp. PH5-5]
MTVAVIDIGSNSIKTLVATRNPCREPVSLFYKTLEARISAGIDRANPALTGESMARGLAAIRELLADTAQFAPGRTILVATSAVRDASNGDEFRGMVRAATGRDIRILTGDEEASYIGRGLACDPALSGLRDFYVFDLGGGSLECLAFRDRRIVREKSLQLGCVRLSERFVPDMAQPIPGAASRAISGHVKATLAASGFTFDLPPAAAAIATGGTTTTARAVIGAAAGKTLAETSPRLALPDLRALYERIAAIDLASRRQIPAMPFGRADVFPTALATFIALAEFAHFETFETSLYNLRWGIAAEALDV